MLDWLKKALGGEKPKTVWDVMDAYGALLETYPIAILDISMLPLPKTQMKVLMKGLYAQARTPDAMNTIEVGFMFLSKFQDGVGAAPIDGRWTAGGSKADLSSNMLALEKWMAWEKLSLAESEILMAEWKRFKLGEPI